MNYKKITLFISLLILLVGVAAAMEVSDDTTSTDSIEEAVVDTQTSTDTLKDSVSEQPSDNSKIVKEEKNVKTASYDINNFYSLNSALSNNNYNNVVLNIKSDIILQSNTKVNTAIKNLQINGNKKSIDGSNQYSFIEVDTCNVHMNNLRVVNCKADEGAVVYAFNSNIQISDSILSNNVAKSWDGGAIDAHQSVLIVNNSILNNNYAGRDGGAINCYQSQFIIINSTINNNEANSEGGAVYTSGNSYSYIINSTLNNNKANSGGAVYNMLQTLYVHNCKINNNTSIYDGGAFNCMIYSSLIIQRSQINSNNALYSGGGAISSSDTNITILNSTFKNNKARDSGAAIQNWDSNIATMTIIVNNTFIQNQAGVSGSAIINKANARIRNNINDKTSKYSATIYLSVSDAIIENNTFKDVDKENTKIILPTPSAVINEKLTLTAKVLTTSNNPVNGGNVIFKLNGITLKDNGKLSGSSNPFKVKVNNGVASTTITADLSMKNANKLTASYIGTDSYNPSKSNSVTMQIKPRTASIVVSSNVKTIRQGQTLTLTAKIYDTTNGKSTTLVRYADEFVYFKVNGITLKDNKGNMLKVKVVNGTATTKYTIPLGLSGVTDGKTMTPKNHRILAGFYNKNYQENIRNTSTFQVERSNITITISNATVNNKTHKLSLTATIKDYLGNIVSGPNKCVIKINGMSLKNGTEPMYYYSTNGILKIKDITIPVYNNYKTIEIVTQDRLAYKSQRNTTSTIKVVK